MADTIERPRLKRRYDDKVRAQLKDTLALGNIMEVPRLEKIVVNMGVGRATQQPSLLEGAVADLTLITGQKPLVTKATKSIAGFKLREGQSIGAKVTLRGDRMWEFLDRLISVAIPRIRDFRGLPPNSWDGRGNYTFGVNEQLIFPEIDYDRVVETRGMDITIVTTAHSNEGGRALLSAFGFPFARGEQEVLTLLQPSRRGSPRGKNAKGAGGARAKKK
jgi:large subunit ribosomal protein L5